MDKLLAAGVLLVFVVVGALVYSIWKKKQEKKLKEQGQEQKQ